jgi:hypothetical protein
VLADEGGLEELRRLGARSVPVVSRGDQFVFAQVISDVVEFLGLDEKTGPALSPAELHARYDHVLATAIRCRTTGSRISCRIGPVRTEC